MGSPSSSIRIFEIRVHYWSDRLVNGCWNHGALVPIGVEVAQAETKMPVNTGF